MSTSFRDLQGSIKMTDRQDAGGDHTIMAPSVVAPSAQRQWVLRSLDTGREYALQGKLLVGREAECQISFPGGHVSRYHANVQVSRVGVVVEDLNSTNGTFVNGRRIVAPTLINLGDEIAFHNERFRLVSNLSGDADATMMFAPAPRRVHSPAPTQAPSRTANQAQSLHAQQRTEMPSPQSRVAVGSSAASEAIPSVGAAALAALSSDGTAPVATSTPVAKSTPVEKSAPVAKSVPVEKSAPVAKGVPPKADYQSPTEAELADAIGDFKLAAREPDLGDLSDFELPDDVRVVQASSTPALPAPMPELISDDATRLMGAAAIASKADRIRQGVMSQDLPRFPGSGPRLIVLSAPLRGKVFNLSNQKLATTWRIGRSDFCELNVNDVTVSHDHARVVRSATGWQIVATHARNGLIINGKPEHSHTLEHGDRLLVGRIEIVFASDEKGSMPILVNVPPPPIYRRPWFIGVVGFLLVVAAIGIGVTMMGGGVTMIEGGADPQSIVGSAP
ncbi:Hypothetical protein HDN1F_32170 [gamma proteobacterium HdN1]|nr:Hypothetical protein HDN1F_32170 [gamma proteobacterium HdN1]